MDNSKFTDDELIAFHDYCKSFIGCRRQRNCVHDVNETKDFVMLGDTKEILMAHKLCEMKMMERFLDRYPGRKDVMNAEYMYIAI